MSSANPRMPAAGPQDTASTKPTGPRELTEPTERTEVPEPSAAGGLAPDSPAPDPSAPDPSERNPAAPPRSRYSMGSFSNMIRSLVVILGMVFVLVAIVPRVQSIQQPAVDAASVVSDAVRQSGLPFEAPVDLPEGWAATNARYAAWTDGLPTWQGGWSTPTGGYVAIRQTKTASPAWIQSATNGGEQRGQVQVAGRTWLRFVDADTYRTSLVLIPSGSDAAAQLATVVTGTANTGDVTADLSTFASALRPAQPR